MTPQQAKHFLLSFDDRKVIDWYNDYVVDSYGDYAYSTIRENHETIAQDIANVLSLEALINLANHPLTRYCECDKYVIVADFCIVSFNSVEELLNTKVGEYIVEFFLQDEEDNREDLESIDD